MTLSHSDPARQKLIAHELHSEVSFDGQFWFPDLPEQRSAGRLNLSPGGRVELRLASWPTGDSPETFALVEVVHGELANGEICTLLSGFALIETFAYSGFSPVLVYGLTAIRGAYLDSYESPKLRGISIKLTHVNEWLGSPYELAETPLSSRRYNIEYEPVEFNVGFTLSGAQAKLSLFCERTIPNRITPSGAQWPYWYRFDITTETPTTLRVLLEAGSRLRQLISILMGQAVYTVELGAHVDDSPGIHLITRQVDTTNRELVIHAFRLATSFQAIRKAFPTLAARWLNEYSSFSTAAKAYTDILLGEGGYLESIFLRIIQTLEQLHAEFFPDNNKTLPSQAWKSLSLSLSNHLHSLAPYGPLDNWEQSKESISRRLGSLNQLSLKMRLTELLNTIEENHRKGLIYNPSPGDHGAEDFVTRLVLLRNNLSHQGFLDAQSQNLEGHTLYCWAILTYLIASRVGLDDVVAKSMADKALSLNRPLETRSIL